MENDYVAVALSNRAVLHWMADESDAAAADLKRAEALSPKSDFVHRNKAALEFSHSQLARADVASK
jgi:Tfp pilus assembly protein PilF